MRQPKLQALAALQVYPGGMQVGGGITAENAHEFLHGRCQPCDRDVLCVP